MRIKGLNKKIINQTQISLLFELWFWVVLKHLQLEVFRVYFCTFMMVFSDLSSNKAKQISKKNRQKQVKSGVTACTSMSQYVCISVC